MNQRLRWGFVWLFFLSWPLPLGAGATVGSLHDEHLSLVNPLTTTATPLNDTTLASVIGAIGSARKDILITPGTWTIADNLTVPANMGLYVAPEAQFSINSGRTLTINGPLHADLRTIFSGAGDVRFGARVEAVHPHWFGAACDGTGNDHPALQKAIEAAATSTYHVLQLPSATCRMTTALTLRPGLSIIGPGSEGGRLLLAGRGVKGLVYTSAVVIEANITLKHFTVEGADTTVGNLIDITGTGGGFVSEVTLDHVRLRNSGGHGLLLDRTLQARIRNLRVQNVAGSGVHYEDSNTAVFDSLNVNAWPATGVASFNCVRSTQFSFVGSAVLEGGNAIPTSIRLEGCSDAVFMPLFSEFDTTSSVVAQGQASGNIFFLGGHYHSAGGQVAFDFGMGGLAHQNIVVEGVTCVLADQDYCFKGVETVVSMRYCNNVIAHQGGGTSTHFNPSTVSPNVNCLRKGHNEVIDGLRITDLTGVLSAADGTITRLITTTASWDFTAIANGRCETLTKTITGAATTDYATALIPHSLHTVGITYSTEISAADTIVIKRCNNSGRAAPDPAATPIKFIIMKVTNIP
jgi:hypothetical protein